MRRNNILWLACAAVLWQCAAPKEKIPPVPVLANSGNKIIVYQMMTRLFGNTKTLNKPYGTLEENGCGKFEDIDSTALAGIKALGTTHIWYTGVLEHALLTDYTAAGIPTDDADVVQGRAGSPYAIKDYYDVDPDLAADVKNRMREFERLVQRTHNQEMRVIIDFVANHVARSYHSDAKPEGVKDFGETDAPSKAFAPSNNYYYLPGQSFQVPKGYNPLGPNAFPTKDGKFAETPAKVSGNGQFIANPKSTDWFDVVKLNYGIDYQNQSKTYFEPIPDTWNKMRDILVFWAGKNVDGFRCDMAEMVPTEFWGWVIPQVKAVNPEILFIAEIYKPNEYRSYLDKGRFDFLYDKVQLYDTLRLMINTKASATAIPTIQRSLLGINDNMVHFLENHDEQRIASPFFNGDPWKALPGMVVSATIDKGPVMIYFGQEVGEPGAGAAGFDSEDGRTTKYDYWGVPEHQKWVNGKKYDGGQLSDEQRALRQFYGDILTLAKDNPAISRGSYFDLTMENVKAGNCSDRIVSFARVLDDEKLVIVAGFNVKPERIKIQLSREVVAAFDLDTSAKYIGRDLLRSGADIGLSSEFTFELDVPPYNSFVIKIKQ
jgi:glycosidase